MEPIHRSRKIQELFESALEKSPSERPSFLAEACTDPELRAQVEELLEEDSAAGSFLDPLMGRAAALAGREEASSPESPPESVPDKDHVPPHRRQIGRYRILGRIGRGGQSTVYLGRRSDRDWQQRVAIKIAHADHESPNQRLRFEQEARILASLEHRFIARLLDSGTTEDHAKDDRKLYLVMEYVNGEPITSFCDSHEISLDERLQLFRKVCSAVQYAHQNLVIHRDLKPSNILVTADGAPKLLDFGIAKLLESDSAELMTRTEHLVATAAYASPEQLAGQRVTTASDVYSLGILLHELLTGFRPYKTRGLSPGEILELLRREDLVRPSVAFTHHSDEHGRQNGARQRQTTPEKLSRRLRGDLDTILAKALAFDVSGRYASIAQLDEDVRRHLEGLPLLAATPSARAMLTKLARRHPRLTTLTLSSVVFVLLLLILGARQNHRIRAEREAAHAAQLRAETVSEFLVDLFGVADPVEGLGEHMPVRTALDRGAARVLGSQGLDPQVRSAFQLAIGRAYSHLGLFDDSEAHLKDVLSELRGGGNLVALSDTLLATGQLNFYQGHFEEAGAQLLEALDIREDIDGEKHLRVAEVLHLLGRLRSTEERFTEAEAAHQRALEIRHRSAGAKSKEFAESTFGLAEVMNEQGDYALAESLARKAIAIDQELVRDGRLSASTLAGKQNFLGRILNSQGRWHEAETTLSEAVEQLESTAGELSFQLAPLLQNLGITYASTGQFERAESPFRRAWELNRRILGPESPKTAGSLVNLATLEDVRGHDQEAITLYRELLDGSLNQRATTTGIAAYNLGTLYIEIGHFDLARESLERSLEIRSSLFEPTHDSISTSRGSLGEIARILGEHDRARREFERVEPVLRAASKTHPLLPWVLRNLGLIALESETFEEAAHHFTEARTLRSTLEPTHPERLQSEVDWALLQRARNRPDEAAATLDGILEPFAAENGEPAGSPMWTEVSNPETLAQVARAHLVRGVLNRRNADQKRHDLERAVEIYRSTGPSLAIAKSGLAEALEKLGRRNEAAPIFAELEELGWQDWQIR